MINRHFDVNADGHSIRCKIYCKDMRSIEDLVVFGHGFGGHRDNKAAEHLAEKMLSKHKKSGILVFEWPAHGSDVKKRLTLKDCDTYITLILRYIEEELKPRTCSLNATSFGAYLFLKYIGEHGNPFRKIVLRCPTIHMYEVLLNSVVTKSELDIIARGRDAEIGFDRKIRINSDFLDGLKAADISQIDYMDYADDILIIQGERDEVVPIADTLQFAEDNVIEFIPVAEADHRFQGKTAMGIAIRETIDFLFG